MDGKLKEYLANMDEEQFHEILTELMDMDKALFRKFLDENLLTKHEAREITDQSARGFDQSVGNKIHPYFQKGEGKGKGTIKLFLREEMEEYAKTKRIR